MPYDVRTFTAPYEAIDGHNLFKDYDQLVQYACRNQETKEVTSRFYLMDSKNVAPAVQLAEVEIMPALYHYFSRVSIMKDLPPVETLPDVPAIEVA